MRFKVFSVAALVVAFVISFLLIGGQQSIASTEQSIVTVVPESVLYDSVFRLDLSFRRKALEQKLTDQPVTAFATYFKDKAGLTPEEDEELRKTAINYLEAAYPIDVQAIAILSQMREQFPEGQVPEGQSPPDAPAELVSLQSQRNVLVTQFRDQLDSKLGKKFSALDQFVKNEFASNFHSIGSVRGEQ